MTRAAGNRGAANTRAWLVAANAMLTTDH
jgi:hypothetical protein